MKELRRSENDGIPRMTRVNDQSKCTEKNAEQNLSTRIDIAIAASP